MSSIELAEVIKAHWSLLWPLPTRERMLKLEEIKADYEFEQIQRCVEREMSCQTQ